MFIGRLVLVALSNQRPHDHTTPPALPMAAKVASLTQVEEAPKEEPEVGKEANGKTTGGSGGGGGDAGHDNDNASMDVDPDGKEEQAAGAASKGGDDILPDGPALFGERPSNRCARCGDAPCGFAFLVLLLRLQLAADGARVVLLVRRHPPSKPLTSPEVVK